MTVTLNFLILSSSEFESKGVSLVRIIEYSKLESEAELHKAADAGLDAAWPSQGSIEFESVTLRHRPSLPPALNGFTLKCASGTHTGIVGRSGAGKSTIAVALFRLHELESGRCLIDGVDLAPLGLASVRARAVAIIPQEPLLFKGTVRRSLDPWEQHTDNELWAALKSVDMARAVSEMDGAFAAASEEGGANWSVGERQLLCFATKPQPVLTMPQMSAFNKRYVQQCCKRRSSLSLIGCRRS